MNKYLVIAILLAVGLWFYKKGDEPAPSIDSISQPTAVFSEPAKSAQATPSAPAFNCDGRTHCSQMTSCAEATYFIQHCPNTEMDGEGDGVPCEKQWCH